MIARILVGFIACLSTGLASAQDRADAEDAQEKPPLQLPATGTELFRGLLHFNKIKPYRPDLNDVDAINSISGSNARIVLIVHGLPRDPRLQQMVRIKQFANAIRQHCPTSVTLIAVGEEFHLSEIAPNVVRDYILATPGLTCTQQHLTPESLHSTQWQECPFVKSTPFDFTGLAQGDTTPEWNPFRGFGRIATRHPASLQKRRPYPDSFVPLAYLPNSCVDQIGVKIPPGLPFAIGTPSRINTIQPAIILADEDILSNRMIALPDTDNLPFAVKLIKSFDYFLAGSRGDTYCVYFEYGERKTRFNDVTFNVKPSSDLPPLPFPPPQLLDKLGTQLADGMADQLDRSDAANSLFNKNQRYYAYLLRLLVLALAVMAVFFFARRAFISRFRNERTAMPIAPLARVKPAKGLVGQMRQDILIGGDYGPVIREYLRELFIAAGLPDGAHARLPAVQYDGRVENTPALIADLMKLWQTAFGPERRIPLSAWKELEPMMLRVWRAAEAGRWRFTADPQGVA